MKFLVMESVPFDLIITDPAQIKLKMKIEKYHSTVSVRANGRSETLNLQYDLEVGNDTDDDITSDGETDEAIGVDSDAEDYAGLVLTVSEKEDDVTATSKKRWCARNYAILTMRMHNMLTTCSRNIQMIL